MNGVARAGKQGAENSAERGDGNEGGGPSEPWARARRRYEREMLVSDLVSDGLQAHGLALAGGLWPAPARSRTGWTYSTKAWALAHTHTEERQVTEETETHSL